MVVAYLASGLVMTLLVVAVVAAVVRGGGWYSYEPDVAAGRHPGKRPDEARPSVAERTEAWLAAFFLLTLAAVAGVFGLVTNPDAVGGLASGPVLAGAGLLVVGYVLVGAYVTARQRGHSDALAAAGVAIIGGVLLMIGVSAALLTG